MILSICRNVVYAIAFAAAISSPCAEAAPAMQSGPNLSLKAFATKPKLVVVVVFDQFRADYLTRFASRFLPPKSAKGVGGFSYLMESGAYFPFAEYEVLQNVTCPGHASILSGAFPYHTGIPLNEWWDGEKRRDVYCIEDEESPVVDAEAGSPSRGASPKRLKTTTVGDELKNAGHDSKVVGISLKDRSAIMLGGHRADLAFWFDVERFRWTSSQYYLSDKTLPGWLAELNQKIAPRKASSYKWRNDSPGTGLSNSFGAEEGFEREILVGNKSSLGSPVGVELTTEAAVAALKNLKLGQGKATDILAISYSSHDILGHLNGPNSREMEELTVVEDRSLAELFRALSKEVPGGLKNVVIALTADHGVAPSTGQALGFRLDAGLIESGQLQTRLNKKLAEKFPGEEKWISSIHSLNLYVNQRALKERKVAPSDLYRELKAQLQNEAGIAAVFSRDDYLENRLPGGAFIRQILKSYVPGSSGDVIAIPKPFWAQDGDVAAHMTGYSYDRTVPLVIAGPHLRAGVYASPARVVDLAPTLSFLLGVLPPAHSEGRVLSEAIGN